MKGFKDFYDSHSQSYTTQISPRWRRKRKANNAPSAQQPLDSVKSIKNNDTTNSWYLHANEDEIIEQDTLEHSRTKTRNILWKNITAQHQ
jgi:hypothetical protein